MSAGTIGVVMKKRILRIALVTMTILLVSSLLVACGLFDSLKEIKKVDVVVVSGLEEGEADGEYVALANGDSMTLSVNWHNARVATAQIEWHEVVDGQDKIVKGFDEKTFVRNFGNDDLDKVFNYYVLVNGNVKSSAITVRVHYVLQTPYLGANLPMTGDTNKQVFVLQQNLVDGAKDVHLTALWNLDLLPEGTTATLTWYVNGVATDTGTEFDYDVSSITDECEIKIEARLSDGVNSQSAFVTLSFVRDYMLAQSVTVGVDKALTEVATDTYYLDAEKNGDNTTFETTLSPLNAKQDSPCKWTLTDSAGKTSVLSTTARQATVQLPRGKNVIRATIQNVESRKITVYVFDCAYDELSGNERAHIENKFFWAGNYNDSYISSQADLNAYMGYIVSKHTADKAFEAYIANPDWRNIDKFSEKCSDAVTEGVDESGSFSYSIGIRDCIGSIKFTKATVFGIPQGAYEPKARSEQINGYLRYVEQSAKRLHLPIDDATEKEVVENSDELYRAVSAGRKPVFSNDENGKKLKALYEEAYDVLATYLTRDMTEYEKVAAIYDWIVNVVDYDYAVAALTSGQTSKYNAFYLEGVFNDHRAVCDGKSKAFALLCGMEGIKAVRVVGYANKNLKELTPDRQKACGHAWNKVFIDADDDGEREWYVVDTTWGDLAVEKEGASGTFEYLNYAYFLKTDKDIENTHVAKTYSPVADTKVNVYQKTFIEIYGEEVDLYVETAAELSAILAYSKDNDCLAVCVYIAPSVSGVSYNRIELGGNQYIIFAKSESPIFSF